MSRSESVSARIPFDLIRPMLLPTLLLPVLTMSAVLFGSALLVWRTGPLPEDLENPELRQNPLELKSALFFGFLLTLILVLGHWLQEWLGNSGIYLLAATSGITDVDAITLSLTRMSQSSLAIDVAVVGIVIAASVNNLVKAGMGAVIGTRHGSACRRTDGTQPHCGVGCRVGLTGRRITASG